MQDTIGLLGAKGSGKDTLAAYLVAELGYERTSFAEELYRQVAATYGITVEHLSRRDTKETALPFLALKHCQDLQFVEIALQSLTGSARLRQACLAYAATGTVPAHAPARRVKALLHAGRSPRWVMQLWGTEYRRKSKYGVDSYWLDIVAQVIAAHPHQRFVITDVRFINEAKFVEQLGGVLIRIRRLLLEEREAADRARNGTAAHPSEVELLNYAGPLEVFNTEGDPSSLKRGFDQLGLALAAKAA
jgi:hypothetical protein